MKTLLLILGATALLAGCSSTDNGAMGSTGNMYQTEAYHVNNTTMSRTGVLGVGTGYAGVGAGTGLGSGSTGSGQ